jgi:predicted permease
MLLPRSLRMKHGSEMELLFLESLEQAGREGRTAVALVWVHSVWDIVRRRAIQQRRRPRERKRGRSSMLLSDLKLALRTFARSPGLSLLVTGMIALGVGANTAVFTLLNGLYLRPFPFAEPDRLVYLNETAPRWDLEFTGINYPDFHTWREGARDFEGMALYGGASFNLAEEAGGAERVRGAIVTHDYASVIGVRPTLGRFFTPEEDRPNAPRVVVLGHSLWRQRFASARDVLGKTLRVDSEPFTIVGVMPPEAEFPEAVQIWVPLRGDPNQSWQGYNEDGIARLKQGVTLDAAHADLMRAHASIWEQRDKNKVVSPLIMPLRERYVRDVRTASFVISAAVGLVLLIACANVASLMLARAMARRREMGVRMALGAGVRRLLEQLFVENLVFACAGGAVGLLLGFWASKALAILAAGSLPPWATFDLDARVVGFSIGATALTTLLFGWAPALHALHDDLRSVMGANDRASTTSTRGRRTLAMLVAAEVALAAMLLVGSGLMLRAWQRLQAKDPGFRVDNVLTFAVALPDAAYPSERWAGFWEDLLTRLDAIPGVEGAGAVTCLPLTCHWGNFYEVEGQPPREAGEADPVILRRIATPGYFAALDIGLRSGRFFEEGEGSEEGARVVVVNESFARLYWPDGTDPVGKRLRWRGSEEAAWMTIVGVAGDVQHYGLETPMRPGLYTPLRQDVHNVMAVALHTSGDPNALVAPARAALQAIDAELPLFEVRTMDEYMRRSLSGRALYSWLLGVFGAISLILAIGGTYGVTSYLVTQRTREIGIRVALGARASNVVGTVLRSGMATVALGLATGLIAAFAAARFISGLLFGVSPRDPVVFLGVVGVLLGTAMVANVVPARRAARIEPMRSLRE